MTEETVKLHELAPVESRPVLKEHYSNITFSPGVPVRIHALIVGEAVVGFVATEDFKLVAAPHLYIRPLYRTRGVLTSVTKIFKEQYCPLMKREGKSAMITNCSVADRGTRNFLEIIGFTLKDVTIAEYAL